MVTITKTSQRFINTLLDLVLPPRCPMTGELVGAQGTIDPQFWAQLNFIQTPFCDTCGNPFPHETPVNMICGSCLQDPPAFSCARSVLRYDDASASMILKFKHADGTTLVPAVTQFMLQAAENMIQDCDLLVPVPLHRWRLLKRRYNQAALLTKALSRKSGILSAPHLLRRIRFTESQGHKNKTERYSNIHNAFAVTGNITGKKILLVDDVLTSGATINECTKVLLKNGATSVSVLTLARVCHNS